jgi:hypothetical protein
MPRGMQIKLLSISSLKVTMSRKYSNKELFQMYKVKIGFYFTAFLSTAFRVYQRGNQSQSSPVPDTKIVVSEELSTLLLLSIVIWRMLKPSHLLLLEACHLVLLKSSHLGCLEVHSCGLRRYLLLQLLFLHHFK